MRQIFQCFAQRVPSAKGHASVMVMLVTLVMLTSCLNSNDDDLTVYDDMAITGFTLGTLNRYVHATSAIRGDSLYKVTFSASSYTMAIDQVGHRIFNQDSLPEGTDLKHVLCTVTTKNNAIVLLKSATSDTLSTFGSTDSIDFSIPRELHVYPYNNTTEHRIYTVTLSTLQTATSLNWVEASMEDYRQAAATAATVSDGSSTPPGVTVMGYISWAISPTATYELALAKGDTTDANLQVWRKVTYEGQPSQWIYMPVSEDNVYSLPAMERIALVYYEDRVLAFGSNGIVYDSRDQGITWKPSTLLDMPDEAADGSTLEAVVAGGVVWLCNGGKAWRAVRG